MKGLVFTTFYDYCQAQRGPRFLDDLIDATDLPNDGAFTAVGTYPFCAMQNLVESFALQTGADTKAVLEDFGEYCFSQWVRRMPHAFEHRELFEILSTIDDFHKDEIQKLYPDAELPSFSVESRTSTRLTLGYRSNKPLSDLARGVILGAAKYLSETIDVASEMIVRDADKYVRITVTRVG